MVFSYLLLNTRIKYKKAKHDKPNSSINAFSAHDKKTKKSVKAKA